MPPGSGKLDGMFPGIYRPVYAHMHGFFDISPWGVRIVITVFIAIALALLTALSCSATQPVPPTLEQISR